MKKLLKYFIPFIFALFLSLPATATTMNGCDTTAMQGCRPAVVVIAGPTAPFLLEDDFSTDANWTHTAGSVVTGGELVNTQTVGGGVHSYYDNGGSPNTERWMQYDWTVDAGNTLSAGQNSQGSGIGQNTGNPAIMLGLVHDGGVVKFRVVSREDGTGDQITIIDPAVLTFAEATAYNVVLHSVSATGIGNNDGVYEIWVDNLKIYSDLAVDNDTITYARNFLGSRGASGSYALVQGYDDYKLSVNGQP